MLQTGGCVPSLFQPSCHLAGFPRTHSQPSFCVSKLRLLLSQLFGCMRVHCSCWHSGCPQEMLDVDQQRCLKRDHGMLHPLACIYRVWSEVLLPKGEPWTKHDTNNYWYVCAALGGAWHLCKLRSGRMQCHETVIVPLVCPMLLPLWKTNIWPKCSIMSHWRICGLWESVTLWDDVIQEQRKITPFWHFNMSS